MLPPELDFINMPTAELIQVLKQLQVSEDNVHNRYTSHPSLVDKTRQDLMLFQFYRYQNAPPINIPIVVYGGRSDPLVSIADLKAWRTYTNRTFELFLYHGGHFYWQEQKTYFIQNLKRMIEEYDCSQTPIP
ncbi:hypothetical protein GCM10010965_26900 [Caldalkalibacillus thermarum]|nr:hypothetical protein GCM10010965_26900 [Caldalkalibacillus thermarum]